MNIIIFVVSLFCFSLFSDSLDNQGQQWAQQAIRLSKPEEAQILLNLLYWSYQRSITTLQAQKSFLKDQEILSQAIYTITSTRLNPARQQIYEIDPEKSLLAHKKFIEYQQEHQRVGKIYSQCLEIILNGNHLSPAVLDLAYEVRNQARTVIAYQLYLHLREINQHLKKLQEYMQESYNLFQKVHFTRSRNFFFQYLWDFLPSLFVKSYIHFDRELTDINHQLWHALLKSEEFSNYRRQIIEEKRAEFYATYYNALYQHMQQVMMPQKAFLLLFDGTSSLLPALLPLPILY